METGNDPPTSKYVVLKARVCYRILIKSSDTVCSRIILQHSATFRNDPFIMYLVFKLQSHQKVNTSDPIKNAIVTVVTAGTTEIGKML
jgi:hypothetical protein